MKYCSLIFLCFIFFTCSKDELFSDQSRHDLWLIHEGAELPIVIEGNTNSKLFLILLHGGPGSTAQEFNAGSQPFTDVLEEDYALVYYDQRNSGLARGEWEEDKLTIEQHVEDLDNVIDLINHKFGSDITLFLAGHSWGGYLGTAYLLDAERQAKVQAWINIDGQTNRNLRNRHNLERITSIANQQITANVNVENWSNLSADVQTELDKNISNYTAETENAVNRLKAEAEKLIDQDGLLVFNSSSIISSIYNDNYDPFLILTNERKGTLIEQMYAFDEIIHSSLLSITIPILSIYGKYDVTTGFQQGEYLNNNTSTLEEDKKLVTLNFSGHSSMKNEPLILAEEIKQWIEKYK